MRPRTRHYGGGLWWLTAPYLVGTLLLVVVPAVVTAGFAFTRYDGFTPPEFAGLDPMRAILTDPEVRQSLVATGWFLVLAVPLRLVGGLVLALLLHRRERLATPARVAAYVPVVVPDAATALVWLWIVNPVLGPVGVVQRAVGATPGPLLLEPWGARLTVVALTVFALGEGFLITLAARRELPAALYEVARLEGAGPLSQFRRVTLPQLAPVLGLLGARDLLVSLQVSLVPILLLTRGGPLRATLTLPALVYERGFKESVLGEAAALALLTTLAGLVLVAAGFRLLRRWTRGAPG